MTATFLLPLAQGACEAVGGNIVTDAFGVVAMVAMTPLITLAGARLGLPGKRRRAWEARKRKDVALPDGKLYHVAELFDELEDTEDYRVIENVRK